MKDIIRLIILGVAWLVSWFFGLPDSKLLYPVVVGLVIWEVLEVKNSFQDQLDKIRQEIVEVRRILDEELERTS